MSSFIWDLILSSAFPASYSSRVSPQHTIGVRLFANAACTFLFISSSVSKKYPLLSECPNITYFTPKSFRVSGEISPVNAPFCSKWQFSAPIFKSVPSVRETSASKCVAGAHIALSTFSLAGIFPATSFANSLA